MFDGRVPLFIFQSMKKYCNTTYYNSRSTFFKIENHLLLPFSNDWQDGKGEEKGDLENSQVPSMMINRLELFLF